MCVGVVVAGLAVGLPLTGETGDEGTVIRVGRAMGTRFTIEVSAKDRTSALAASEIVLNTIEKTETRLTTWRTGSELDRLNRASAGDWVAVSQELERDLAAALDLADRTGGAFDPVIGSLVEAWDLRGNGTIPDRPQLDAAVENVGHGLVEVRNGSVRKLRTAAIFDEGGFGKGIALRDSVTAAVAAGADCVRLDLGGQLVMTSACGPVTIDIADPRDRSAIVGSILVEGASVATSGNSVRSVEVDGSRIGHLIDPRNGQSAKDWGAVTVIARDPLVADCLATALFVMGPDQGLTWLDGMEDIEAIFAIADEDRRVELRGTEGIVVRSIGANHRVGLPISASSTPEARHYVPPRGESAGRPVTRFR